MGGEQRGQVSWSCLVVLESAVRIILHQTVFLANFVMSGFHLFSPLFFPKSSQISLSLLPFIILSGPPNVFTLAAAQAADHHSDDYQHCQHRQSDDQSLEVHPTLPPASLSETTHTRRGQDRPHRVIYTLLISIAPQTRNIGEAFLTSCVGFCSAAACCGLSETLRPEKRDQQDTETPKIPEFHIKTALNRNRTETQSVPQTI